MKKNDDNFHNSSGTWQKIFIVMKLKVIILLCCVNSLSAATFSQNQKITLDLNNANLTTVLENIKTQTGLQVFFQKGLIPESEKVSIQLKKVTLDKALDAIFENRGYEYSIINDVIVIRRSIITAQQQNPIVVTGVVVDSKGTSLPGVTVIIKGTSIGATTDENGAFRIALSSANQVLVFSFMGMNTQEVSPQGDKPLKITMIESAAEIEEVIVTGIFSRKKESFTGSAQTYTVTDLKKMGTSNVLQSLKTLDPSFAIIENNIYGSDPNRLPNMEIRGKSSMLGLRDGIDTDPNQPLFILDGFESSLETINDLDINRIESITILKDAASTAIYGSKAANGVVVVETIKPEVGKLNLTYNGNANFSIPDLSSYNLMNAREKLEFEVLTGKYDPINNHSPYRTEPEIKLFEQYNEKVKDIAKGVDTYWIAEPVRIGVNHKHSIYVTGGEGNFMFGLGGNYNGTTGAMKDSDRRTLGGNLDLIYRVAKFQFSNKFSSQSTKYTNPLVGFSEYAKANPFYTKYDSDGNIKQWLEYNDDRKMSNPMWDANLNSRNEGRSLQISNYFIAEWKPTPEWNLRARFGLTYGNSYSEIFTSPDNTNQILTKATTKRGEYSKNNTVSNQYEGELTLTYAKLIKKHRINLVLGGNLNSNQSTLDGYEVEGFPSGNFTYPSFANGYPENGNPQYIESVTRSINGYFNTGYSFDDRFLMDVSLRSSGSSVFGSTKKFNTTWSVGLGWNIHKEKFFAENVNWVNFFKIRGSIGNPGNQSFDSGKTLITYAFQDGLLNYFGLGALPDEVGNPNLKWQITNDKNIGVDLTLFNRRLSITYDYFHKVTDPLLIGIDMPLSSGTSKYFTNAGKQISSGNTFTINYYILRNIEDRLLWSIRINGRTQKNKLDKIGDKLNSFNNAGHGVNTTRYIDGSDPDDLWAVKSAGIDPSTGKELFYDVNGDYTYTFSYDNEVKCGNTRPDLEGVIGTSFTWKGLSLSFNFRYQLGAQQFNSSVYNKVENIDLNYNQDKRALYERWQKPGDVCRYKNIKFTDYSPMTSRFIQTERSLALESALIQYEFIDGWITKLNLTNFRIFVSMRDVFKASTIRNERGTEYPFARTLETGLSFNF